MKEKIIVTKDMRVQAAREAGKLAGDIVSAQIKKTLKGAKDKRKLEETE
jgi:hypothetical protein